MYNIKDVIHPNADPALRRIVEQQKGSGLGAAAWDVAYLEWPLLCDLYRNHQPIAMGTADLIVTDNDLMAWAQDNPNVDAFGYRAHGKLTGPDGQAYNLSVHLNCVWDPDGTKYKQTFKIQLIPTGRK